MNVPVSTRGSRERSIAESMARPICDVPSLAMLMGEHCPKTPHGGRGKRETELCDVALEKGSNESFAPGGTVLVGSCEERTRESSSQPELVDVLGVQLGYVESGELDELDATGQSLRRTANDAGEALPRIRKRPRFPGRSTSTLRTSNKAGIL